MVDGGEGEFFGLEGLPDEVVAVDDLLVLHILQLLQLHVQPERVQHLHSSTSPNSHDLLEQRVNFELGWIGDEREVDAQSLIDVIGQFDEQSVLFGEVGDGFLPLSVAMCTVSRVALSFSLTRTICLKKAVNLQVLVSSLRGKM